MNWMKDHPVATLAVGVAIGVVFYSQIKRLPGVSKLPQA